MQSLEGRTCFRLDLIIYYYGYESDNNRSWIMKISTKGRYGLRLPVDLARHNTGKLRLIRCGVSLNM